MRDKNLNFFYEDIHLLLYFIFIVTIFFIFFSFDNSFIFSFLSLVSSISNIGISLEFDQTNLSFIYLILVIIGGSFFSTSSGLRFLKIYSLTKYSLNQILSFSKPKNVFMNKLIFSKINFDFKEINKYFLTIVIFIISLFILTSLLSLSNIDFESSFKLAILTLMNTVNSSAYGLSDFNFIDLHFITKYFLIFFMIIGRVELLSLLLIVKKFLFKY
ncbi:potassium transporter TrkG [Candidatus Pelagibacter sp.]|nr:potassium transporter TrkG [Candidatus Pelagibacter sp.]